MKNSIERILISETELQNRIAAMGKEITELYQNGKDPLFVGILKGSFIFLADLVRQLPFSVEVDFLEVSSYGDATESSGIVRLTKDLSKNIAGRDVILVEDIIDTGLTLEFLAHILQERQPNSIKICTLLDKKVCRKGNIQVDFSGFEIPNEFVIGYGLDFAGHYRNLPYIGILKKELYT